MQSPVDGAVMCVAMGVQSQQAATEDIVTTKVVEGAIAGDRQVRRRACEVGRQSDSPAPALVPTREEFRNLSELCAIPAHTELQRSLPEGTRALPGSADVDLARIAEVEVCPHGAGFHAHAPGVLRVLPEGIIGFGKGKRFLLRSEFKVDPAPVCFNIRKPRT